jgi:hypothetical protein
MDIHRDNGPNRRRRSVPIAMLAVVSLALVACSPNDVDAARPITTDVYETSPEKLAQDVLAATADCKELDAQTNPDLMNILQQAHVVIVDGRCDNTPDGAVDLYDSPTEDRQVVFTLETGDAANVYCSAASLIPDAAAGKWIPTIEGFIPASQTQGPAC